MILSALLALVSTQCGPYDRSHVVETDLKSPCLYWREGTNIEWRINDQGNPENMGAEITATQKAIDTWQTQLATCSSLSMKLGPRTPSRLIGYVDNATDNLNVVLWRFKRCTDMVAASDSCWADENCGNTFDCWEHNKPGALAITTTSYDRETGRIIDSDIELNYPSFLFTTVDSPRCVAPAFTLACVATDVQNTMTHELGHALGLAHSCHPTSTMYFKADQGELNKRELDLGSKQFVCETYPKDQASRTCSGTPTTPAPKGCGCSAAGAPWPLALLLLLRRRPFRQRSAE